MFFTGLSPLGGYWLCEKHGKFFAGLCLDYSLCKTHGAFFAGFPPWELLALKEARHILRQFGLMALQEAWRVLCRLSPGGRGGYWLSKSPGAFFAGFPGWGLLAVQEVRCLLSWLCSLGATGCARSMARSSPAFPLGGYWLCKTHGAFFAGFPALKATCSQKSTARSLTGFPIGGLLAVQDARHIFRWLGLLAVQGARHVLCRLGLLAVQEA